ncbi:putative membrane protein [Mitosporidium daphniae]|uniref:Putative membrane protein n=1 Tax=Mitosporidium daphniae TaxID=1485682 RepID=A0A098VUC1_9MICR|nr:uncharacterized protein DI09_13p170 [Mitosporidium daphniae]KGG52728.1 putative membrane protein [Mitosporidium daphniae]|eukprot:XP_013239155.1 uncharacterized protein DI09_13p170 [Mitosporidium daphniae]
MNLILIEESLLQQKLAFLAMVVADMMQSGLATFYIVTLIQNIVGKDFLMLSILPTHVAISVSVNDLNQKDISSSRAFKSGYNMKKMERLTRLLKGPLDDPKASEISSSRFSAKELSGGYDEKQTTKPFAHSGHIQCSDDADDSEHVEANHNVETTGAFGPPEGSEVAGVSLAPQVDKTMATSSTQANNGNSPDVFITIEDSRFKVDANLEKSEDKDKNFNSDKDIDKIKVDSRIISRLDNLKKEYEKMKHEPDSSILKGIPFCSATKNNILGIHFIAAVFAAVSGPMCFSGSLKDQCYGSIVGIIAAILLYFTEISILFNRTQVFISSIICGFLTFLFCYYDSEISFWPIVLGATLWNLPGFSITMGVVETFYFKSSGGIIGVSMLIKGMSEGILMALGFGVSIYIGRLIFNGHYVHLSIRANSTEQFSPTTIALFSSSFLTVGATLLMEGSRMQILLSFIPMVVCNFVLFGCIELGMPSMLCDFLASFSVCILSMIISEYTKSSYLVYVYNGILPLVPGGNFVKETFGIIEDMVVGDYEHPEKKDFAKTKYPPFMSSIVSAFSIGLGIIVSDSIYNLLKKSLLKLKKVVTFYQILLK